MKHICLTACIAAIFCACRYTSSPDLPDGLWRIRKIEILKEQELKKVIDTCYQLWSFKSSIIRIFDRNSIQNILYTKTAGNSIRGYDIRGMLQDEFVIQKITSDNLSLASKKRVQEHEYQIIYYLDRLKDSLQQGIIRAN